MLDSRNLAHIFSCISVQGDPSGCFLGCVDIKTKFAFQYIDLKHNVTFVLMSPSPKQKQPVGSFCTTNYPLTKLPMAVATTTPAVRKPQTENPLDLELMLFLVDPQSEPDSVFPLGKYWYLMPLHMMPGDIRRMQKNVLNMMSVV